MANFALVNVSLPVPLQRVFTYILPPEFAGLVHPGSRVVVPFGRKYLTGIAVDFPASTEIHSLKPLHDVLDAEPAVTKDLLALSEWISEYYLSPRGEVLKALLPQGISIESKRMVELRGDPDEETAKGLRHASPARARIVDALRGTGRLSVAQLQKRTGVKSIHAALASLESTGLIAVVDALPASRTKTRHEWIVSVGEIPPDISIRGKRRQELVGHLRRHVRESLPVSQILKESGSTIASLRALADLGLLRLAEREVERKPDETYTEPASPPIDHLTQHQTEALTAINAAVRERRHQTFLLHGVTGSGKTQVYIEAIRHALELGRTAILLVPEISLTPQIVRRFRMHFGDAIIVMHSRMSPGERYDAWRFTRRGTYRIAIGPRSAIFAPLENLGLVVVDEEHEASYKQYDASPRYHARDVAIVRASKAGATVVLGSATPSIESYFNAQSGKYRLLSLPERVDNASLPSISIVDMTVEHKRRFAVMKERAKEIGRKAFEGGFHSISGDLELKIRDRLSRSEGIILLQNRRGFAPFLECLECGYVERCDSCDVTMTYHLTHKHLRCHYCGAVRKAPESCSKCHGIKLQLQGFGTQRVEQDLVKLFPDARIIRMDLDTTSQRGAHDAMLSRFAHGDADILLGTQMVAKGLDFPRVTLVGVISADTQMLLPDFRAAERTFQLLTQVAGRAGRSTLRGEVIIQSHQTSHYTLRHILDHNYAGFFAEEAAFREEALYPPYARIALIEAKSADATRVEKAAETFARYFRTHYYATPLLGPTAAVIARIQGNYRWHMVIKAPRSSDPSGSRMRAAITDTLNAISTSPAIRGVRVVADIDPQGTM